MTREDLVRFATRDWAAVEDEKVRVSTEDGYRTCREALEEAGLLLGHSAGAALFAARELARSLTSGVVVALFPDGGERYLGEAARG